MGGRVITRTLDMSNYALQVNKRDTILNDIWGQCRYSFGDWIPNIKDERCIFENFLFPFLPFYLFPSYICILHACPLFIYF